MGANVELERKIREWLEVLVSDYLLLDAEQEAYEYDVTVDMAWGNGLVYVLVLPPLRLACTYEAAAEFKNDLRHDIQDELETPSVVASVSYKQTALGLRLWHVELLIPLEDLEKLREE